MNKLRNARGTVISLIVPSSRTLFLTSNDIPLCSETTKTLTAYYATLGKQVRNSLPGTRTELSEYHDKRHMSPLNSLAIKLKFAKIPNTDITSTQYENSSANQYLYGRIKIPNTIRISFIRKPPHSNDVLEFIGGTTNFRRKGGSAMHLAREEMDVKHTSKSARDRLDRYE